MAKSTDILKQLQERRAVNITNMSSWSIDDFQEMLITYSQAREIALESLESESVSILDEKLSQLNEALLLKTVKAPKHSELDV